MNNKSAHMGTAVYLVLLSSFIFAFVSNFANLAFDRGAVMFFSRFRLVFSCLSPYCTGKKESPYQLTKQQVYRIAYLEALLLR